MVSKSRRVRWKGYAKGLQNLEEMQNKSRHRYENDFKMYLKVTGWGYKVDSASLE
jgi:hypothetical protein